MPFFYMLDPERVEFTEPISSSEIDYLVSYPKIEVLQCNTPIKEATWFLLNSEFFSKRPEVELRVYGPDLAPCDLSFTARMSHVRHFTVDLHQNATGIDAITEMPNLKILIIRIYGLDHFNFLWKVTDKLTNLILGATRSRKPDLSPLSRFCNLKNIFLVGQQKNIQVLSQLSALEEVGLSSISTPTLGYLKGLQHMKSLKIILGGIRDFSAIEGMQIIEYLQLTQVRELYNINFVARLPGLQHLELQSLPRITTLPSFHQLRKLRRIGLYNLKGLRDFSALEWSPALEEFVLAEGQPQQPEDFLPVLRNPSLRRAWVHFGSLRKEQRFRKLLLEHGIEEQVRFQLFN
jgi:hypothetical protein